MYVSALERDYDETGLEYWASALANFEITGETLGVSFFLSEEMMNSGVSDADYVYRLYATFMNRVPDVEGLNYWMDIMTRTPDNKYAVAVFGFTRSPEFSKKCVESKILPYS